MNVPDFITDVLSNLSSLSSKMNITSVPSGILGTLFF